MVDFYLVLGFVFAAKYNTPGGAAGGQLVQDESPTLVPFFVKNKALKV